MRKERDIITATMDWQGITLSVSYEAEYLGFSRNSECAMAHLQVEAISPARTRLPITETGYRSHFIHPSAVEELGGPVAYARTWLDHAAKHHEWQAYQEAARQMSLF